MGHVKHAFILSFFHLLLFHKCQNNTQLVQQFYQLAIKQTIELGGDTDTNAAIVGALIGALVGV
jgi:ADP-ribosylglycohydrolase